MKKFTRSPTMGFLFWYTYNMEWLDVVETQERNQSLSLKEILKLHYDCDEIILVRNKSEEVKDFIDKLDGLDIEVL